MYRRKAREPASRLFPLGIALDPQPALYGGVDALENGANTPSHSPDPWLLYNPYTKAQIPVVLASRTIIV